MPVWKTAKTVIKNIVEPSADEDWLLKLTGTDQKILAELELIKKELWQEGYIELDTSNLKPKDFDQIRSAARRAIEELSESD
jgi:hypothetical protein